MAPKVAAEREVNAMSIRLWRRFKVAPGIRLNLSKGGLSTSLAGVVAVGVLLWLHVSNGGVL